MRIILKIIAAPAVLALTLIVAVLNFSVSFGLPAAAEWLVCKLDDLNYSLKTFIAG